MGTTFGSSRRRGDSTVLFYNFEKHANSQPSAHGHTRRGGKSFLSAQGVLLGNPDWSVGRTRTREGDRQPRLISCLTFHFHVRAEEGGEGENNKVSESEGGTNLNEASPFLLGRHSVRDRDVTGRAWSVWKSPLDRSVPLVMSAAA